jgi:hypothetical protein
MPIEEAKKFSSRRGIAAATGDLIKLQRGELHPGAAACCVPAIVIILVCGRVFDQPYAALVATAGAFSVGFGLFQRLSSFGHFVYVARPPRRGVRKAPQSRS